MADKTTGELPAVKVGDLPLAPDVYDDALLPVELQGSAMHITGAQWKRYAVAAVKDYSDSANRSASAAQGSAERAETAMESIHNALSNLPAGDTLVINDLTTGGTTAALSAEMGKLLGKRPNPNLLHNWYFVNPVNQRGQTEYLTAYPPSYTIDRWKCMHQTLTVNTAESVTLTSAVDYASFIQVIEHPERLSGRRAYLSFMYKSTVSNSYAQLNINGTWTGYIKFAATEQWKVVGGFFDLPDNLTSLTVGVSLMSGGNVEFKAIKLELGSTQTLAHQDADGNWVLNEIPDYGEELRKCQRYLQPILFGGIDDVILCEIGTSRQGVYASFRFTQEMLDTPELITNYMTITGIRMVARNNSTHEFAASQSVSSVEQYSRNKNVMVLLFKTATAFGDNVYVTIDAMSNPSTQKLFVSAEP